MLKVNPPEGYPPEEGRYARGNDFSPVAVCVILDDFDFRIPSDLQRLVVAGLDAGAAIAGMLQTENVGMEKMICNVVANPNVRHLVLCGREASGHMPGESLLALKHNGLDEKRQIVGSTGPTPYLANLPLEVVDRFREQIVSVIDLLCEPGENDTSLPGLNPELLEKAVWSCIQEDPVDFLGYSLCDVGAYPEPPIVHRIVSKLEEPRLSFDPAKVAMGEGLRLRKFIPNTDCQECGRRSCLAFAIDLFKRKAHVDDCSHLYKPWLAADRHALLKLLE